MKSAVNCMNELLFTLMLNKNKPETDDDDQGLAIKEAVRFS